MAGSNAGQANGRRGEVRRFPEARRFEGRPFTLGDLARWAGEFGVPGEAAIIGGRGQIIRCFDVPQPGCIGLRCDGLGIAVLDDLLEFAQDHQIPEAGALVDPAGHEVTCFSTWESDGIRHIGLTSPGTWDPPA